MSCKQLDCQAAFFPDVPPLPPFPFLSPPLSLLHSFLGALSTFGSLSKTKIKERERERVRALSLLLGLGLLWGEIRLVSQRGLGPSPQGDLSQGLVGAPCPPHAA